MASSVPVVLAGAHGHGGWHLANIDRLVGGAGEETIIARVGEGTVSSIGSADSHKWVLENPDAISTRVLERGLDAGTAFEILSIDIADVDIGRNVGAELQTAQAEADKNIAQARAEERRAMAVAEEQEMRAKVVSARYFGEQILPPVTGLLPAIEAGADDLYALSASQLR